MAETGLAALTRLGRDRPALWGLGFGLVFAAGQAPLNLWYLALPALVGLLVVFRRQSAPRAAGWTAWAFGVGYFGLSMSWLVEPFLIEAAVTGWMAPFALVLAAAGLALFWAWPAWAAARLGAPWLIVPLWALSELARAYVLTGFPWGLLAYLWAPTPAAQWLAFIGPHGLTLATLALAALAAAGLATRRAAPLLGALALGALLLGGGALRLPAPAQDEGRPVVRIVQPNAPQDEKWQRENARRFFARLIEASAAGPRPELILWPETALPMLLNHAGEALSVASEAAGPVPLVFGIQREEGGRYYNSAALMTAEGEIAQTYDKHHLVPFGEYMPAAWFFRHINVSGLAQRAEYGYSAGPGPALLDLGDLGRALPLICYEAVFPQDVGGAPGRAAMILQLTNDAWFGTWSGPYQHLMQARMRAIEQGLPVLRAANTGVSAVIDAHGRTTAALGLGETGYIDAAIPAPLPPTPYARTGDLPALLLLLGVAGLGLLLARRNRIDPGAAGL
ncbi:apolipoprotein N-acyltransferase [Roseivivax sp. GX 12232]|uniref:apolipoprotein N-acyltransferase n=1 Tax=Roseivivax sp. GX 12232 TaxID=2900547 RepID=UPI001E53C90D|nr:apolipoprotein N-acyltransferase [Roseivivax sp. GX 12232]MCE0506999.1 apolipoprotein N-acyltransferase [Roseivivax sp. GX 12232]